MLERIIEVCPCGASFDGPTTHVAAFRENHRHEAPSARAEISSGDVFAWRGIPGEYPTERFIRVDSMTARCEANAVILVDPDETPTALISIGLADLEVAIRLGFLVKVPKT